jgi:PBP1b-binding outer membrane lipoprotein LpoB
MNTKKLLSISVIAISLLVFAGCKTKTVTAPSTTTTTTTTTTTPTTPTTPVANGKTVSATQAQCLDLIAYGMKIAIDQGQAKTTDADALAKKASDLEMKYRA